VVAALGLLALVALASEEAPFDVQDDTGTVHGPSWMSIVLLAVIVMMIAFTVLLALSARTVADGTLRVRRRRSMIQMLVLAALAFLALLLIHASGTAKPKPAPPEATPDTQVESPPEGAGRDPGPPWAAIALGGAVLVVLAAAAMTRRHLVDEPVEGPDGSRDAVLASLASSMDALTNATDDRAAIIAAYAALLEGLARAGVPRRIDEAPEEYVRRVLTSLHVSPEPLDELTSLFSEARFSEHPLGQGQRVRAVAALEAARSDLMALA
jgi:hypothetical protein